MFFKQKPKKTKQNQCFSYKNQKNLGKTKITKKTKKTNPGRLFSQIESTGQRVAQDCFFGFFSYFGFS